MTFNFKSWDIRHTLLTVASVFGGAVIGYLESQPTTSLLEALQSWKTAQPVLIGALFAGLSTLLAMAKSSFIDKSPAIPPAPPAMGSGSTPPTSGRSTMVPPKTLTRLALAFVLSLCVAGSVVVTGVAVTGCTPAQWANFQTNAAAFAGYVQTFLQGALMVWQIIAPLLGQNAAAANKAFQDAYVACTNALGVFQDAVNVANAAQTSPDLNALMGPVKDACSRLLAVIAQFQGAGTASVGSHLDELNAQGQKIWSWK